MSAASDDAPAPTSVYRYYDPYGVLVYVGITSRGSQRQSEHNRDKAWWPFVASQEVDHYPTRDKAASRERALIHLHRPPFNRQHNPDHEEFRREYLRFVAEAKSGEVSALDMHRALNKALPLTPVGLTAEGRLVLRTSPAHHLLARGIRLGDNSKPQVRWEMARPEGHVRSITHDGLVVQVTVGMRGGFKAPVAGALMAIRLTSQKPLRVSVRHVELQAVRPEAR